MTNPPPTVPKLIASPVEAIAALLQDLAPVETETLASSAATGRILAEPIRADRDSPPADVSAMDGYALRLADAARQTLPVAGEIPIGQAPPPLPPGAALRIFTGSCVPPEAELVIRREDVRESPDQIILGADSVAPRAGQNIRRQGENLRAGQLAVEPGGPITPATAAALATLGCIRVAVFRSLRVGVIVTGNELQAVEATPHPWQIRDSNGPTLRTLFAEVPWAQVALFRRVADDLARITAVLDEALRLCDAIFLTGGVSAGDHDYVPAAVAALGARIVFHKLPIRPGKPILAAVGRQGQIILGLPGNPVSALVTARRFGAPALRKRAGFAHPDEPLPAVRVAPDADQLPNLWWYRPVRLTGAGTAEIVPCRGSGDMIATAHSDGFIELPPATPASGYHPFWPWRMT